MLMHIYKRLKRREEPGRMREREGAAGEEGGLKRERQRPPKG